MQQNQRYYLCYKTWRLQHSNKALPHDRTWVNILSYFTPLELVYCDPQRRGRKLSKTERECVSGMWVSLGGLIDGLTDENIFPHGHGVWLNPVFLLPLWWLMNTQCHRASTTLLLNSRGNGHIQEGRGGLMGSDDRARLNTYQSSLRELHFIDRLPPLSLNPLAALCANKWAKHTSQAWSSGNFYWFDLCSEFPLVWKKALQGNCSDQSSRCCVVVSSVLRYAGVPASSTVHTATKQVDFVLCHGVLW